MSRTLSAHHLFPALVLLAVAGSPSPAPAQEFTVDGEVRCLYIPTYDHTDFTNITSSILPVDEWSDQSDYSDFDLVPERGGLPITSGAAGPDGALFNDALQAMSDGDPTRAAEAFWTLTRKHPESPLLEQAIFLMADTYFDMFSSGALQTPKPAIEAYKNAIMQFPHSPDIPWARFQIARANMKVKLYYEANAALRIGIEDGLPGTWLPWFVMGLGNVSVRTRRLEEAKAHFEEVLRLAPGEALEKEALLGIIDCYCLNGEMELARTAYREVVTRWPESAVVSPISLFLLGDYQLEQENYEEARAHLLNLYNLYPGLSITGIVLVRLGDTFRFQGKLSLAGRVYNEAIGASPAGSAAHLLARFRLADMAYLPQASIFTFGTVGPELLAYRDLAKSPASPVIAEYALYRYAIGLYSHTGSVAAIDALESFLERYPSSTLRKDIFKALRDIFHQLVQCWHNASDLITVVVFYERNRPYLLMPPIDEPTIERIADSYKRLGLYQQSLQVYLHSVTEGGAEFNVEALSFREIEVKLITEHYTEVLELGDHFLKNFRKSPRCARVHAFVGDAYYHLDDHAEAIRNYGKALELSPKTVGAARLFYRLGNANKALKQCGPAVSAYEKAIKAAGRDHFIVDDLYVTEESLYQKGFALYDGEEYAAAEEALAEAMNLYPFNPRAPIAMHRRAEALLALGRKSDACEVWRELVLAYPLELWRKLAEERLARLALGHDENEVSPEP